MYVNKVPTYRLKCNRYSCPKNNKSRSIITYNESKINSKNNNYINQMKKEMLGKHQEEQSFCSKKTSRNIKQKSIDNSNINQNIYNNTSVSFNQPHFQKKGNKQNRKLNNKENMNNIFKGNLNSQNNIFIMKENNKNKLNKNNLNIITNNIKNTQYQKTSNLTSGSNYSFISFSNIVNEPTSSNEKFEESKDNFFENMKYSINNGRIYTTYLQIDDLTPIPDRIGGKQHRLAEYDYDEAKRAAVTCRRIEYSYNLRNVLKSEICIDEIITIQRWWRDMLRKRNKEILKEFQYQEKIKLTNMQNYILFLNKVHYIYTMHLVNRFINRLRIKYGKLFYKNLFNRYASKIQKAFRLSVERKKLKDQLKLKRFLKRLAYKKQKRKFLYNLNRFMMDIDKIKKLQNYIKYYLLKKNENYYLKGANDVHPFIYYYLKYGVGDNDKNISKIKYKKNLFLNMIQKWKDFIKYKRLLKIFNFLENIKFIMRKKYYLYFIIRIVERINAVITYFLLKPLMIDILKIYYNKKMANVITFWKANAKKLKKREILGFNIILKLVNKYAFKLLIKRLKKIKKDNV
jgi:hypothetical protein